MMSISALGVAGGEKANYCQAGASAEGKTEGYYQKDEEVGRWTGSQKMMEALGLEPGATVTDESFARIIRGQDPKTGEPLTQKAGENHRAGWDCTMSAPKSVSALWAVADEKDRAAISAAHDRAVERALEMLQEEAAFARRGKGGAESEKLDGLIVGKYEHGTSRELDPDLHTHCIVMNLAQREDGSWGGIESKNLYEWQKAAGATYRAELAKNMQELGFKVEADRFAFKIEGVPDELCKDWSKRRGQIKAALDEAGHGSAAASEVATLGTRKAKVQDQDPEALRERWKQEAAERGLTAKMIHRRELVREPEAEHPDSAPAAEVEEVKSIADALTQHDSASSRQALIEAAMIQAQHQGRGADEALADIKKEQESGELVRLKSPATGAEAWTSRNMIDTEKGMMATGKAMAHNKTHGVDSKTIDKALADFAEKKGFSLSPEQQSAVRHICSGGQIATVRGAAGAGKSTMAEAAKMAWESSGFKVVGAALAGKAAEGLESGSGIKSGTLHRLLFDVESGKSEIDEKTIILIDEAGMVGSKQMKNLLDAAQKSGAKVVLIGDERQLQAVDAGGAFAALQRAAPPVQLNESRRQKDQWARDAAEKIALGKGKEGLADFVDQGLFVTKETKDEVVCDLIEDWHKKRDVERPGESLILTATRDDAAMLNRTARQKLIDEGELGERSVNVSTTSSGKLEMRIGERLMFLKNDRETGLKNGQMATLAHSSLNKNGEIVLTVKTDAGKLVEIDTEKYDSIAYGYAVTTHKAQGVTVDHAHVFLGGGKKNREMAYVQASRARIETKFYVESKTVSEGITLTGQDLDHALDLAEEKEEMEEEDVTVSRIGSTFNRSEKKGTTLDYQIDQPQPETEAHQQQQPAPTPTPEPEQEEPEWEME